MRKGDIVKPMIFIVVLMLMLAMGRALGDKSPSAPHAPTARSHRHGGT